MVLHQPAAGQRDGLWTAIQQSWSHARYQEGEADPMWNNSFNSWINKDFSSTEVNSTWSLRQLFSRQFLLYSRFNSHFCFGSVVQRGTKLRGRVRINRSVQHLYIKALSLASFQRSSPTRQKCVHTTGCNFSWICIYICMWINVKHVQTNMLCMYIYIRMYIDIYI